MNFEQSKIIMKKIFPILLLVLFGFSSCQHQNKEEKSSNHLKIAISKMHGKKTYSKWLHNQDSTLELYNMYPLGVDSAIKFAKNVDAILITGGEDVYPGYYGEAFDTVRCGNINHYRDSLEMALIKYAVTNKVPLFGVCRGEQIINVTLGGSLIIDIPLDVGTKVKHSSKDWKLQWHNVNIVPNTLMAKISGVKNGKVSSSHHQAIKRLGNGLLISAYADDSIPEAIEWNIKENHGFLMATQWHPEHMNYKDPLSNEPAKLFLREAKKFQKSRLEK